MASRASAKRPSRSPASSSSTGDDEAIANVLADEQEISRSASSSTAGRAKKTRRVNYTLHLSTSAMLLKKLFNNMEKLVTEINIEFTSSGMQIQAMDSAHVSLINVFLRKEGFNAYNCARPIVLGILVPALNTVLKAANSNDMCEFKFDEDGNPNVITISLSNEKGGRLLESELKLIDIDSEKVGIPKTEYDVVVSMDSLDFKICVNDFAPFKADIITISATSKVIVFLIDTENGKTHLTLKNRGADETKEENSVLISPKTHDSKFNARFAMRYLSIFSSFSDLADTVVISLQGEVPMAVSYDIPEMGNIKFYLAPKIEDDN